MITINMNNTMFIDKKLLANYKCNMKYNAIVKNTRFTCDKNIDIAWQGNNIGVDVYNQIPSCSV